MKVQQLIELLAECNPDADVVISVDTRISDYTWGTDDKPITGVMPWPEPKADAKTIELCT